MSSHYQVVLHVRPNIVEAWSDREVVSRWHQLFKGLLISPCYAAGDVLLKTKWSALLADIAKWRERLMSVSWFMRVVNESIARKVNKEDDGTGSFWESRFQSPGLLDERSLLSCMAYVDLNPIRANLARSPEQSEYTSIAKRIELAQRPITKPVATKALEAFVGINEGEKENGEPINEGGREQTTLCSNCEYNSFAILTLIVWLTFRQQNLIKRLSLYCHC